MIEETKRPKDKVPMLLLLSRELDRLLDQLAAKQGESRSSILRTALREYAKREAA